jgi:hypothetical protein
VDAGSGELLSSFGAGLFSMPHGLTTDAWGNLWVTDVGLHQVLKFSPSGELLLTLGEAFEPGSDERHFCKPTHVAVASDGSFFVADGYCNARILAYAPDGTLRGAWAAPRDTQPLNTPHALALDECADLLHVADRENGRVLTISGALLRPVSQWALAAAWALPADVGLPYGLTRAPGGDVFALAWARQTTGGAHLVRLSDARAESRGMAAPPAAAWPLPGVTTPHDLAFAPLPGGGPGFGLYVAETRPEAAPREQSPSRFSLGDVLPACVIWPAACDERAHGETEPALQAHGGREASILRRIEAYKRHRAAKVGPDEASKQGLA